MEKLLIVLVLMVGVIAIAQMMRVYEISAKMRGKKEEDISHNDNVFNANMMLVFMLSFYALFFWLLAKYGNGGLGPSASVHGDTLDWLMNFNFYIIIFVFFICNTLLFWFAFKYYHKGPGTKAYWFTHDNKLELFWTSVPAVVLAIIIILGLRAWNDITADSGKEAKVIEIYSKQFDWTVRYSGDDNKLGRADFRMINAENPLGVLTKLGMEKRQDEIRAEIVDIALKLYKDRYKDNDEFLSHVNRKILVTAAKDKDAQTYIDMLDNGIKQIDSLAKSNILASYEILSIKKEAELFEKLERLQRHLIKISAVSRTITDKQDAVAMDDKVVKELYLLKGQEYEFQFRSMDVLHSAFFPHFRAQMNTVPGMTTRLKMTPKYSTAEMRKIQNNEKFDYILLCNKICGVSHSNMQIKIYVMDPKKKDEKATYDAWLSAINTIKKGLYPEATATDATPAGDTTAVADTTKVAVVPQ
jgi:cytochrome c oxidase subunit II